MSILGENASNKNYFSNTEEVYDLIKMLLQEIYSKEISDVGMFILLNGNSTLFEIQSKLKLSFENVRNYLIIMLQNNLIKKKALLKNESKSTSYELKIEQFLNILFFPRTLNFIENKYGIFGKMIFEQFIEFGVLTLEQIIDQIQKENKNDNGKNNIEPIKSKIIELLMKLYEDNIIMYSERIFEDQLYYSPIIKTNNLLGNKEELKKNFKKSEKKIDEKKQRKKNEKENIKNKNIKLIEDDEEENEDERILNIVEKSEKNLNKIEEFYENNTKNNMHFYINFDQIRAEFQSEIIIDYINNNISYQSAILAGELLKAHKVSSFSMGMTNSFPIAQLAKNFKSISYQQIEDIIKNNNEIFIKSSSDDVFLNLNKIRKEIKSKEIQKIIISKFSPEHFRIYNLINLLGSLEGEHITNLSLILPKNVNSIINSLFQEGFIKTESGNNNNGNKKLLFSVDEYQTIENILKMDYKIIINYKSYYNHQLNNIKNKFKSNKKQNEDLVKLTYIIDQICDNILIMKFF